MCSETPLPPRAQYPNKVKNTYMRGKTCFTYRGWSFQVITISKRISCRNFDFVAALGGKLHK